MAFYRRRRIRRRRAVYRRMRRYGAGRRIRRRRRNRMTLRRLPMLLPDAVKVPLRTCYTFTPIDTGSGLWTHTACLNDHSYNTQVPTNFAQWASFYDHCFIPWGRITLDFVLRSSGAGQVSMFPFHGPYTVSSVEQARQQPYSRTRYLGSYMNNPTQSRLSLQASVKKVFGEKPQGVNFGYSVTTSLNTYYRVYVYVIGEEDDGALSTMDVRVTIIQLFRFYRRALISV